VPPFESNVEPVLATFVTVTLYVPASPGSWFDLRVRVANLAGDPATRATR
jgi:hypothetical protein